VARPIEEGIEYFQHDHDMRNDPRVRALRKRFPRGLGHSTYCMTLELFTDSRGFTVSTAPKDVEVIAADFDLEAAELAAIWEYCVSLGLLQRSDDGTQLWSTRYQERHASVIDARRHERERKRLLREHHDQRNCPAENTSNPAENPVVRELSGGKLGFSGGCRHKERRGEDIQSSPLPLDTSVAPAGGASGGPAAERQPADATPVEKRPADESQEEPMPRNPEESKEPMSEVHQAELERSAAMGNTFSLAALRDYQRRRLLAREIRGVPALDPKAEAPASPPEQAPETPDARAEDLPEWPPEQAGGGDDGAPDDDPGPDPDGVEVTSW
jgi:hypothetical protein